MHEAEFLQPYGVGISILPLINICQPFDRTVFWKGFAAAMRDSPVPTDSSLASGTVGGASGSSSGGSSTNAGSSSSTVLDDARWFAELDAAEEEAAFISKNLELGQAYEEW